MAPRLKKPTAEVPVDYYRALEDAAYAAAELVSNGLSSSAVESLEEALEKLDALSPDDETETYPYAPEEETHEPA